MRNIEVIRLYHRSQHVLVDYVNRFHALSVQDGSDVVVDGEQVCNTGFARS